MGENVENKLDHINDKFHESDCQGCGQFPDEFECVECGDIFCRHEKSALLFEL